MRRRWSKAGYFTELRALVKLLRGQVASRNTSSKRYTARMQRGRWVGAAYALFFFSGIAGLVYEVIWSRLLKQVFGVTDHAIAAVLATYLAGLGLGGWILGRVADRSRNPLRLYGLLEMAVGATAVIGTLFVRFSEPIHVWAASRLGSESIALASVRALLAALVVMPATFLMGGTLPAMTKALVHRVGALGGQLSLLYALNTLGAVAGSLAAGFLLILALGTHGTLWLAVGLNLAVGAIALLLSGWTDEASDGASASPPPEPEHSASMRGAAGLLLATGLSGVASLALEVIWTRLLVLIVGTSTHAFVTMLCAFLLGIALGSFIARAFVDRVANPRQAFGWVQAAIAASILATIPMLGALVTSAQRWLSGVETRWLELTLGRFGIAFLILIVPTTLIGITFPLAAKIRVRELPNLGGQVGQVYGANILGNIAGAVLGGFVLLPAVGIQRSIALLTTLNLASAAWGLMPASRDSLRTRLLRAAPVVAAFALCVGLVVLYRPAPFTTVEDGEGDLLRFYKEGLVSTVKVVQRAGDARQLVMLVDGARIGQSSSGIDMKQQVLAHLPFMLEPDGRITQVLSIGLGTGILVGEVAKHPGVQNIECVEISPPVIEGARFFRAFNGNVLENPAVHVILDDGVNYLKRTRHRYDAIISDGKSKLGHVQNALFYSEDYYRYAREHLTAGGLMIQWMPLEEVPEDLRTIVRTFTAVFPHAYLFIAQDSCFLVGTERLLAFDLVHMQRLLDAPQTADLRRYGWRSAPEVAATLVADEESAKAWLSRESTVNSLERPVLEFYSPRALTTPAPARIAENIAGLATARAGAQRRLGASGEKAAALSGAMDDLMSGLVLLGGGDAQSAVRLLEKASDSAPEDGIIRHWVADVFNRRGLELLAAGDEAQATELFRRALRAWPDAIAAHLNLGNALAAEGAVLEAGSHFLAALKLNPDSSAAHRALGNVMKTTGNMDGAMEQLEEALRIAPDLAEVHNDLGELLGMKGQTKEALAQLREAMRLQSDWPRPMALAALMLATAPDAHSRDPSEAIRLAKRAADLSGAKDGGILEILAASYAAGGQFDQAVKAQQRAIDLAGSSPDASRAAERKGALDLYRRGLPRR